MPKHTIAKGKKLVNKLILMTMFHVHNNNSNDDNNNNNNNNNNNSNNYNNNNSNSSNITTNNTNAFQGELGICKAGLLPPKQSVLSMLVRSCYAMQVTIMYYNIIPCA